MKFTKFTPLTLKISSRSNLIIPSERTDLPLTFCLYASSLYLQWFKSYKHLKILKFTKFADLTLKNFLKVKSDYTIWKSSFAYNFCIYASSLYLQWFKSYKHLNILKFTKFDFFTLKNSFKVKSDCTIWKSSLASNFLLIETSLYLQ